MNWKITPYDGTWINLDNCTAMSVLEGYQDFQVIAFINDEEFIIFEAETEKICREWIENFLHD